MGCKDRKRYKIIINQCDLLHLQLHSGRWGVEAVLISIHKWFPNSLKVIRGATYCESQFPKFLHHHPSLPSTAQWRRINLYANKVTNVILSLDPERLLFSPTMPKTVKLTFSKDLTVF